MLDSDRPYSAQCGNAGDARDLFPADDNGNDLRTADWERLTRNLRAEIALRNLRTMRAATAGNTLRASGEWAS
jgi:hypothetical protein